MPMTESADSHLQLLTSLEINIQAPGNDPDVKLLLEIVEKVCKKYEGAYTMGWSLKKTAFEMNNAAKKG